MYRILSIIAVMLVLVVPTYGQNDSNRLVYGQTIGGVIDNDQFRRLYVFSGEAGDTVSLAMSATEGDLDPYLVLMTPTGNVIAVSDDDGASNNAVITAQVLPMSGDYFIVGTRFGQEHGTTSGNFQLSLGVIGGGSQPMSGASINIGRRVTGQISQEVTEHIYRFEALRGQVLNIQMRRTSGSLDPMLDLLDGAGQPLISGDDDPFNEQSSDAGIANFTIPDDGIYYIRATRYGRESGSSFGTYVLSIDEIPVSELGTTPANARLLSYGDRVSGEIDDEVYTRFFRFEGQRGDVISVIVTREGGNIAPRVSLLNNELRTLSISPDAAAVTEARIPGASLPQDGVYYIAVSRYQGSEGFSVGTFDLEFNGRRGIGAPNSLEMIYGAQLSGSIDDAKYSEIYLFVGEAGDRISISMERLEGDLDPLLTLRDPSGKQLDFNDDVDPDVGNRDSLIEAVLPVDGIYTIEASRFEKHSGTTSGIYVLTMDKLN